MLKLKKKLEGFVFKIIKKALLKRNIVCLSNKELAKKESPVPYRFIDKSIRESNSNLNPGGIEKNNRIYLMLQRHLENYEIFFDNLIYLDENHVTALRDEIPNKILLLHGQLLTWRVIKVILHALENNCKILYSEDGFLSSITRTVDFSVEKQYRLCCSLIIDKAAHFDCSRVSRIEEKLNSSYEYTDEEIKRAKDCIDFMLSNYISKYNNQPIKEIKKNTSDANRVLIVDQAVNDFSICMGGCSEGTFIQMLDDAVRENPNSEILIKVHPDMIQNPGRGGKGIKRQGHFTGVDIQKYGRNIRLIAEYLNPISLIKSVDKVYVATSQLGFEALLCQKEVIIYGMPFYAGWGLGECRSKSPFLKRRNKKRSLYEVFYAAYIDSSIYINPELGKRCEIEEVLHYLLEKRTEYFEGLGITSNIASSAIRREATNKDLLIPIVFCFNRNYLNLAKVAIWSLLDSNNDTKVKYRIYCIYESDVERSDIENINRLFEHFQSLESLRFIKNTNTFEGAYEFRGITKPAYTRLMLHRLLQDEDKVIYSDVDVIFKSNLRELYQRELGDYCFGACIDVGLNDARRYASITAKNSYWGKYLWDKRQKYYSSGILLINLEALRKSGKDSFIKELSKCELPYHDMDIINIIFNKRITPISSKYCVIPRYMGKGYLQASKSGILPEKYAEEANNPVIYHFAGKKPWHKKIRFNDIWWDYVNSNPKLKSLFK